MCPKTEAKKTILLYIQGFPPGRGSLGGKTSGVGARVHLIFYKKYFKDVSREFDEFEVNTHICNICFVSLRITLPKGGLVLRTWMV